MSLGGEIDERHLPEHSEHSQADRLYVGVFPRMQSSDPVPKTVLREVVSLLKQVTYALDLLDGTQQYCDVTSLDGSDA